MSTELKDQFVKKTVHFKEDDELCDVFFYSFPCDKCDFETASKKTLEYHLGRHYKKSKSQRHKFWSLVFSFSYLSLIYLCLVAAEEYYGGKGADNNLTVHWIIQ